MSIPTFGQRSDASAAPPCPRHPGARSVDYCKRCNRPMCIECAIPTEVRSICVECAHAERPRRRFRFEAASVTGAIVAICWALHLIRWVVPSVFSTLAFAPILGLSEPWRFLTTAFLHVSFWHILLNSLALVGVGQAIEPILGKWRFAAIYLLSALGGSVGVLAWCLVSPEALWTVTVGASGAVFGLFGAVFVLQKVGRTDTTAIVALLLVNLAFGFLVPGVSWQAHLGGMVTGAVVTWLLLKVGRPRRGLTARRQQHEEIGVVALAAIVLAAVSVGLCLSLGVALP